MCFFKKRRAIKQAEEDKLVETYKEKVVESKEIQPKVEKVQESKIEKTIEPKVLPVVTSIEESALEKAHQEPKIEKQKKYHVSQNKEEDSQNFKKWRVRKEGSTKTIKFFNTQKEAILYAEELSSSAGSSVVIHKVDGSIRKQDYQKKA